MPPNKTIGINCNLTILEYIKNHSKLPKPSSLGLTYRTLGYRVKKLAIEGIIKKIGYGTWEISKDKLHIEEYIKIQKELTQCHRDTHHYVTSLIRGHGFIVTLKLPNIENWNIRETYLKNKGIEYKPFKGYQRIFIKEHKVWLSKSSIVIYTPKHISYYERSAEESKRSFLYNLYKIFISLENLLGISLKIGKNYAFSIVRQHYGKINDEIAQEYNNKGKKLFVRNEHGLWLLADYSLSEHELEGVHQKTAVKDIDDVIVPFLNDLKEHYEKTNETILISDIIKSQAMEVKQMAYVQKALMDITRILQEMKK